MAGPEFHKAKAWLGQGVEVANGGGHQMTETESRWPAEFRSRFKALLCAHGKDFARIQKELPEHSTSELVEYYYAFKQTDEYKRLLEEGSIPSKLPAEPTMFHKSTCEKCEQMRNDHDWRCCSSCERAYHAACVPQEDLSVQGTWSCPVCNQSYSTPEALEQAREAVRQELVYRELAKQRYDSLMDPTQKHRSLLASARMHPAGPGEGLPVTEGAKLVDDQQHTANGADVRQSTTTITTTTTAMMITNDAESNKPSTGEPSSYGNEEEDDDDEDEGEIEELNGESREPHARSQPSNASSSGSAPAAGYAFPPPLKPRFTVPNIPWTVDETVLLVNLVKQYAENWDEIVKDERYVEVFASRRKLRSLKLRWRFAKRHGWVNKAGEYVGPTEYAASEKNVVAARKRQREMELRHYQSTVVPQEYITTKATALPLHNLVVDALHETDSRALLQPGVPMLQLPVLPPEQAAGSSALPHLPSTSAPLAAHALHHPLLAATSSHAQQLSAHSSFMSSSAQSVKLKTVTGQYSSAAAMSSPTLSGPPLKKPSLSSSNTTSVPRADSSQPLLLSTGTQTQLQYVKLEPHVQPLPTMSTLGHAPAMPPPIMPSPVPPLEHLQRQPLLPPSGLAQVQFNLQLLAKAQAALRQRQLVPRQGLPMPPPPPSSAASSLPHLAHLQEHEI